VAGAVPDRLATTVSVEPGNQDTAATVTEMRLGR
jgi:hypothetical protein